MCLDSNNIGLPGKRALEAAMVAMVGVTNGAGGVAFCSLAGNACSGLLLRASREGVTENGGGGGKGENQVAYETQHIVWRH